MNGCSASDSCLTAYALSISTLPHCRHSTWTAEKLWGDDSGRPLTETCHYRIRPKVGIRNWNGMKLTFAAR